MDLSTPTVSPLRQRMLEDLRMRKFEPKTQASYLRAVRKLAAFLKSPPDTATAEDLRRFQMHLVDEGASPITLNATISGLKFFFDVTLSRGELMAKMQPVHVPRTLPVVLSREEVSRLIAAAWNLKHQTAMAVAYGAGLRASEVIALKVGDIDSQRVTLRVEQGKGRKDRYALLPPILLQRLRVWWRVGHAQGKILRNGWLSSGLDPMDLLSTRQLNRAVLHHYRHRAVATSDHRSTARGFLPRGLSSTCPQVCAMRRNVASHGQVSNNPKHKLPSTAGGVRAGRFGDTPRQGSASWPKPPSSPPSAPAHARTRACCC